MNINNFLTGFSRVLMSDENDHIFSNLKLYTAGVTSIRTAKLLNFATSCLTPEECYLEVGVFTGYTMASASYLNNRNCIGIDSFQPNQLMSLPPQAVKERCMKNLQTLAINCLVLESDFRDIKKEQIGQPVGVHFIDGDHNYKAVMDGIDWITPMLSKDAVVVFDDVCYPEITRAINDIRNRPGHELVFLNRPLYVGDSMYPVGDKVFGTGIAVMRVSR